MTLVSFADAFSALCIVREIEIEKKNCYTFHICRLAHTRFLTNIFFSFFFPLFLVYSYSLILR